MSLFQVRSCIYSVHTSLEKNVSISTWIRIRFVKTFSEPFSIVLRWLWCNECQRRIQRSLQGRAAGGGGGGQYKLNSWYMCMDTHMVGSSTFTEFRVAETVDPLLDPPLHTGLRWLWCNECTVTNAKCFLFCFFYGFCRLSASGCTYFGSRTWSRPSTVAAQLLTVAGAPLVLAAVTVAIPPLTLIYFPAILVYFVSVILPE